MRHVYDWGGSSGCRLDSVGGEEVCVVEQCRIVCRSPMLDPGSCEIGFQLNWCQTDGQTLIVY